MLHIKTRYFIELRDRIFVKEYENFSFAKSMSKSLGSKYNKKLLDHGNQSAIDAIKLLRKEQFKIWQKQPVVWSLIKLLKKLQRSKGLHLKIL